MIPLELAEGEQLLLLTPNSVWIVRTRRFHRSPRVRWVNGRETLRRGYEPGDGVWRGHTGARWLIETTGMRLRIEPACGRADGCAVHTGGAERVLVLPAPGQETGTG